MFVKQIIFKSFIFILFALISPGEIYEDENISFIENGVFEMGDKEIVYGYISRPDTNNNDAVLYVYRENVLVDTVIITGAENDSFTYIGQLSEDRIVVVCEKYVANAITPNKEFLGTTLLEYDINMVEIERTELTSKPKNFLNVNYRLLLEDIEGNKHYYSDGLTKENDFGIEEKYLAAFECFYKGLASVNGVYVKEIKLSRPGYYDIIISEGDYSYSFQVAIDSEIYIEGQKTGEEYAKEVKIFSLGELFLNGEPYEAGVTIQKPGNYELTVKGQNNYEKKIQFSIAPTFMVYDYENSYEIQNGEILNRSVIIYSNGISLELNDEPYSSRVINDTGEYKLTVIGINDYKKSIWFEIQPQVVGVQNEGIYDSLDITIFGIAKLNGQTVTGTVNVTEPGDYILKLLYKDQVFKEYHFTVQSTIPEEKEKQALSVSDYKYGFILLFVIGVYFILRKK